jgi:hypothetical protein
MSVPDARRPPGAIGLCRWCCRPVRRRLWPAASGQQNSRLAANRKSNGYVLERRHCVCSELTPCPSDLSDPLDHFVGVAGRSLKP